MKKINLKRPLTITVANQKGGAGKSTITRYLAYSLSLHSYHVLVVDEDPQSNTTKSFVVTKEHNEPDSVFVLDKTMMAGIRDHDLTDLVVNILPNLDLIPAHYDLKNLTNYLSKQYGVAEEGDANYHEVKSKKLFFLRELLEPLKSRGTYDFIFIDTPPTSSDYTDSAVGASDYVLVAFQTQSDSLDGAHNFIFNPDELPEKVNEFGVPTDVLGILPNQMQRSGSIDETVMQDAVNFFGKENMFKTIVPYKRRLQSAPRNGLRNDSYWDKDIFTSFLDNLTNEFIERVNLMESDK
ncbi:ParA family protein [Levilactobacillus zymae]|uniref:ParA family protein n=1 Tax=Levilactobacillus zymae TaxID=267363 RepID=UPI0028B9A04F|nr:ParA family protein [Levilactobacillus zymae]MDT6981668.1 ParA family protein [Levilactobacillus zymae]